MTPVVISYIPHVEKVPDNHQRVHRREAESGTAHCDSWGSYAISRDDTWTEGQTAAACAGA